MNGSDGRLDSAAAFFSGPAPGDPDTVAEDVRGLFTARRDPALARAWARRHLPSGDLMIHGAGSFSARLLPVIRERDDIRFAGFVDQHAAPHATFHDAPVRPVAAAREAEHVLVAHTCRERDMRAALLEAGIAPDRVIALHEDPIYIAESLAEQALADLGEIDCFVIHAGRSQVIADEDLVRIFPPERTAWLSLARADYRETRDHYPQLDLAQSLGMLDRYLARDQPKLIYLATAWFNNFLFPPIRRAAPDACLIHEVFDWNILAGPDVALGTGHGPCSHGWNLIGEHDSARQADLIVSKRDGPFSEVADQLRAPYLCYHTRAHRAAAAEPRAAGDPIRIIYGGLFPEPGLMRRYRDDYAFLPVLEALAATGAVDIEIYNTLDPGTGDTFVVWRDRFPAAPLRYYPGLPFAAFLERSRGFDFGWLASVRDASPPPDQRCLIPNRMVGYLSAGLPVIVDSGWSHAAALVKEYGAGLVVDDFGTEQLLARLTSTDHERMRQGVAALAERLVVRNEETVAALHGIVADAMSR